MITALEKLMRTRSFQNLVIAAEAKEREALVPQRRAWAARLHELRATRQKRLAPLIAKFEKLEATRLPLEKSVIEARNASRLARLEWQSLDDQIGREITALEIELRDSASEAFREYREELYDIFERFRRDESNPFGINARHLTKEGYTEVFRLLTEGMTHALEQMPLDAEIVDAEAAIAAHRQAMATQVAELAARYDRNNADLKRQPEIEQRIQRELLEQDLAFRRRRGWPAEALEDYRREEEKRLGLPPTVGA